MGSKGHGEQCRSARVWRYRRINIRFRALISVGDVCSVLVPYHRARARTKLTDISQQRSRPEFHATSTQTAITSLEPGISLTPSGVAAAGDKSHAHRRWDD